MVKRTKRIAYGLTCFFVFVLVCLAYSYFIEPNRLVVNRSTIQVNDWNKEFNGFRIVAISDIHGGSNNVTEEKIRQVVKAANAEKADIIVLLGDYVSQSSAQGSDLKMPVDVIARNLTGLKAKYGVYGVFGNHDGRGDRDFIKTEFQKIGITMLEDELASFQKNGETLRILGLRDHLRVSYPKSYTAEIKDFVERNKQSGDLIVLEHSPDVLPWLTGENLISEDLRLIVAGHTHGGQVWFPLLGSLIVPSSYGQKYAGGHIFENNIDMFVTTGIGTSILPFRFMMPPEIAVITIESK